MTGHPCCEARGTPVAAQGRGGESGPQGAAGDEQQGRRDHRDLGDEGRQEIAGEVQQRLAEEQRSGRQRDHDDPGDGHAQARVSADHLHHEQPDDRGHREREQVTGRGQGGHAAHPHPGDQHLRGRDGQQRGARQPPGEGGQRRTDSEQGDGGERRGGARRAEEQLEGRAIGWSAEQIDVRGERPRRPEQGDERAGQEGREQQGAGRGGRSVGVGQGRCGRVRGHAPSLLGGRAPHLPARGNRPRRRVGSAGRSPSAGHARPMGIRRRHPSTGHARPIGISRRPSDDAHGSTGRPSAVERRRLSGRGRSGRRTGSPRGA